MQKWIVTARHTQHHLESDLWLHDLPIIIRTKHCGCAIHRAVKDIKPINHACLCNPLICGERLYRVDDVRQHVIVVEAKLFAQTVPVVFDAPHRDAQQRGNLLRRQVHAKIGTQTEVAGG